MNIPALQIVFALLAMGGGGFLVVRHRRKVEHTTAGWILSSITATAVVCLSILVAFAFDPRFTTYKAFYEDIEVGMTREQLLLVMQSHYPEGGSRKPPKLTDETGRLSFFMDPEEQREPNCEGIFLTMSNNTVIGKHYSPD